MVVMGVVVLIAISIVINMVLVGGREVHMQVILDMLIGFFPLVIITITM